MTKVRVDKFLHAVRIFKTRSLATDECGLGKVIVNGLVVKASRDVQTGDEITIRFHGYNRSFKILQTLEKRVGASLVEKYIAETTPEDEIIKREMLKVNRNEFRPRGLGRPTKKERRDIDRIKGK